MDTKEHILNVAERLFAEDGFDAISVRAITQSAKVNLASINYHFGSKEGLIQAAFLRRVRPINAERLRLLDDCEAGPAAPTLAEVVRAFVTPEFRLPGGEPGGDRLLLRFIGRAYDAPGERLRQMFLEEFADLLDRFGAALERALPGASSEEVMWRLHFVIGVLTHTLLTSHTFCCTADGLADSQGDDKLIARVVEFSCAGLRAAMPGGNACCEAATQIGLEQND